MPLYRDALESAWNSRVGRLSTKFASPEHLILLGLEAFRGKDRARIRELLLTADMNLVGDLLERFDNEDNTLTTRLQDLYGTGIS